MSLFPYKILLLLISVIVSQSLKVVQVGHNKLNNNQVNVFESAELKKHNEFRKLHRVPPLKISNYFNKQAQTLALKFAADDKITPTHQHSKYGVNTYVSPIQNQNYQNGAASQSWYDEVKDYDFNKGLSSENTDHFTQLVWKGSKKVGFGIATSHTGKDYIVALYFPKGNIEGHFLTNVLPKLSLIR